jgi:hypothetical protein
LIINLGFLALKKKMGGIWYNNIKL